MSQFLSLSAFAAEVGWRKEDLKALIEEEKIKSYQLMTDEPYIPKSELAVVRKLAYTNAISEEEVSTRQYKADRESRARSRKRIAAERDAEAAKAVKRRASRTQEDARRE